MKISYHDYSDQNDHSNQNDQDTVIMCWKCSKYWQAKWKCKCTLWQ